MMVTSQPWGRLMRVLFSLLPARGSLEPLLPVAAALREAGHEVAFASSSSFAPVVQERGFRSFPVGLDWLVSDPGYIQLLCEAAGGLVFPDLQGPARFQWVVSRLFIGGAARAALPDLTDLVRKWGPDLLVCESLEFAGGVAAERAARPHVSVAAASDSALDVRDDPVIWHQYAEALQALRRDAGLHPDPGGTMLYPFLHLCFTPPSFDGPDAPFPQTAAFHRSNADIGGLPDDVSDTAGALPDVLVSLGTVFHRTPMLLETILAGLRQEPVRVHAAVGFDRDPASFGPQPPSVELAPWLPLQTLLRSAALLVTHGGFNSVKEAISAGVPMVVVPIAGDQHYSAQRCAALGIAEVVSPAERTSRRVQDAVRTVLHDPGYRTRVHQLRQEMATLPALDSAIHRLEHIAANGGS